MRQDQCLRVWADADQGCRDPAEAGCFLKDGPVMWEAGEAAERRQYLPRSKISPAGPDLPGH